MAKMQKDLWGNYHLDVTEEVARARRDEQFRQGLTNTSSNMQDDLTGSFKSAAGTTAAMGAGAVLMGVVAARNLRFRYKLQAFLHFPFAIFVSAVIFIMITVNFTSGADRDPMGATLVAMGLAVPVGIIWSLIYIKLRTLPKLRRLEG